MITKTFKVYGHYDGTMTHRQRVSFQKSVTWDFSKEGDIRVLEIINSDRTGTNDYSILRITRNTAEECYDEMRGQLSDGVFENSRTGEVYEVMPDGRDVFAELY